MCKIATYVKSPILRNWLDNVFVTLLGIVNSRKYDNLEGILNLISSKDSTKDFPDVVIIDVENDLYSICIKKLTESSDCIKIIAVGFPKTVDETKILFNSGIKGYIDITISDLNFLKAIMLVKNNHYYLAENHIDEILSSFYFTKTSFKIDNFSSSINNNDNSEKYFLSGKKRLMGMIKAKSKATPPKKLIFLLCFFI
jgi:hypothetical protein